MEWSAFISHKHIFLFASNIYWKNIIFLFIKYTIWNIQIFTSDSLLVIFASE